jgi:hypothetical protein
MTITSVPVASELIEDSTTVLKVVEAEKKTTFDPPSRNFNVML